jgi:hypothetical protein
MVMISPGQTDRPLAGHGHKVKLVLAFASTYLLWGSDVSGHPLRGNDHSPTRHSWNSRHTRRRHPSCVGMCARLPTQTRTLAGRTGDWGALFPGGPLRTELGGKVRAIRICGAADCNRADVHPCTRLAARTATHYLAECVGARSGSCGRGTAHGSGIQPDRNGRPAVRSCAAERVRLGRGRSSFTKVATANGRTAAHRHPPGLRRGDAPSGRSNQRRVSNDAVVRRFAGIAARPWISHCVRFGSGVHCIHLASAAVSAGVGSDSHVRQPGDRSPSGVVLRLRTLDFPRGVGVRHDSRIHCADPARRTKGR